MHSQQVFGNYNFTNKEGGESDMKEITVRRATKVEATAWWIIF